jgi:hypothetical protein
MVVWCDGSLLPAFFLLLPTAAIVPRSFPLYPSALLRTTPNLVDTYNPSAALLYELLKHPGRSIVRAIFAIAMTTFYFAFSAAATPLDCCTLRQPDSMRLGEDHHVSSAARAASHLFDYPQATPCFRTPSSPVNIPARHSTHYHVIRA